MTDKTKSLIRNIYLYLATFVGLIMVVVSGVALIKLGLETWFLPDFANPQYYRSLPPEPYMLKETTNADTNAKTVTLSEQDQQAFEQWKQDYEHWKTQDEKLNEPSIQRRRTLVDQLALMIGGLALFLSHGYILRRDKKRGA